MASDDPLSDTSVNRRGSPLEDPRVESAWTTVGPEPSSISNIGEKKKKSKKSNISSKQAIFEQEREIGKSLEEND